MKQKGNIFLLVASICGLLIFAAIVASPFLLLVALAEEKTNITTPSNAAYSSGLSDVEYQVSFVDEKDQNRKIFKTQTGSVAEGTVVTICYPNQIIGVDGHIWKAVVQSPQVVTPYQSGTHKYVITYQQEEKVIPDQPEEEGKLNEWLLTTWKADCDITGQDPSGTPAPYLIVENLSQNNTRIKNLVSMLDDAEWHYFYLIGKNFTPQTQVIGTNFDAEYSSIVIEKFSAKGETYTVTKVGVKRRWVPATCTHRWKTISTVPNACLEQGSETARCEKCRTENTVRLPALGHRDSDGNSLCDRCGRRVFPQTRGDQIKTKLHTLVGEISLTFTCITTDYLGSGKMLYLADETLGPEITGICFKEDSNYNDSAIRSYFRQNFVNDLSIGSALQEIPRSDTAGASDYVSLLSEEEYERYKEKISKGQGYFLRTAQDDNTILSVDLDGAVVAVLAAGNTHYGVRPFILLDRPEIGENAEPTIWKTGDLQMRQIGDKNYVFRCVDEDYSDNQANHRKAALFLCDSVIRADIDSDAAELKTLSFGRNNNYKKSEVRAWLTENASDSLFSLEPIYTGVNNAYMGVTGEGMFGQMDPSRLQRHEIGFQLLEDQLFCLSVEEALRYRDELWRFNGSEQDNPETQISPYSGGYYLRTPYYAEDDAGIFRYTDEIYVVDLNRGNIHPAKADSTGIGLRPAFALPQGPVSER